MRPIRAWLSLSQTIIKEGFKASDRFSNEGKSETIGRLVGLLMTFVHNRGAAQIFSTIGSSSLWNMNKSESRTLEFFFSYSEKKFCFPLWKCPWQVHLALLSF